MYIYLLDIAEVNYFYRHSGFLHPDSGLQFRIPVSDSGVRLQIPVSGFHVLGLLIV